MTTLSLPKIGQPWPDLPGGTYAGLIHTPEGLHHLVLLDDAPSERLDWDAAMAWAQSIGADLPSRVEALVLFKHLPERFEQDWSHWTHEQYAGYAGYAWIQNFNYGCQDLDDKSYERRVRAVRRFPIDPSILEGGAL